MPARRAQYTSPLLLSALAMACASEGAPPADDTNVVPAEPVVVARGLNGPIGVLVMEDGTVYVSDSGTGGENRMEIPYPGTDQQATITWGETARVVRIDTDGTETVVAQLPSLVIPEGPQGTARFALLDGVLYVASSAWGEMAGLDRPRNMAAIVRVADGATTEFANTWDFENRENPEPAHRETNPYDLTVGPDNALWVTDAAGNTLYRIDPGTGELELKATFAVMPGPIPNAARAAPWRSSRCPPRSRSMPMATSTSRCSADCRSCPVPRRSYASHPMAP